MSTDASRKVVDYKIVGATLTASTAENVETLLNNGWVLYGFPYIDASGKHYQAMVRYEEPSASASAVK